MTPALEARAVSKRFRSGSGAEVLAVGEVDAVVPVGGFVLLCGPSGSGKTTLLALLGTLERPAAGAVLVEGVDAASLSEAARSRLRRRFGFAFPGGPMLPRLPLWENLTLGLVPRGASVAARREEGRAALARVGLEERLRAAPEELSTGELQRAVLARALVGAPAILVVDEPLANLDGASARLVVAALEEFHRAGGTAVVASHDEQAFPFATERIRLAGGRRVVRSA